MLFLFLCFKQQSFYYVFLFFFYFVFCPLFNFIAILCIYKDIYIHIHIYMHVYIYYFVVFLIFLYVAFKWFSIVCFIYYHLQFVVVVVFFYFFFCKKKFKTYNKIMCNLKFSSIIKHLTFIEILMTLTETHHKL